MRTAIVSDVATITMGQAPLGSDCNKDGIGTVFVKAGEFGDRYPDIVEWTTKPQKMAKAGDTLVCVVGATAGKVNQAIDCAIGRSAAAVRGNPAKIDQDYLYRFFETRVQKLRRVAQGLAQGVITREMLNSLEIPLPPLPEQRRIAGILDQADALRRRRRKSLSRLSDLGQAIFYEMFGDLSQTPRTHVFSDIAQIQKSLVDPRKQENWDKLHVGPEHIEPNSGNIDWSRVNTAKSDGLISGKNEFDETSLIYSKIRPNLNKVALPDRSGLCSADMYVIKPRNGLSNRVFLQALMMTRDFLAYAETVSNRANIPKLNREQVDAYRFGCPSHAAQNEFERLVNTIKNQKDEFTLAHSKANSLFASLQHRAFRGEL